MRLTLAALGLTALALPSFAQDPSCAGRLTSEQILGCFRVEPKTRGFPGHTRGITVQGEQASADETSVNLMVNFEFDSARLSNDGMISLDALGHALSDPSLRGIRFRIAGHTDGVGSDAYNQKLSEARASAVRAYLGDHFKLDPANFDAVGFGKTQLLDANDPTASVNRRVQVTKLK